MAQHSPHNALTIYDFCANNRVEVIMQPSGIYNCFINYKEGDRPWGEGPNVLDAIENGVIMYLRYYSKRGFNSISSNKSVNIDPKELQKFFSTGGRIFWYYLAHKYEKKNIIAHYENEAMQENPDFVSTMRFLVQKAKETIEDINTKLYDRIPAINNIWIQCIVYYESFIMEKYENNKFIMDLLEKSPAEDKEAFNRLQKVMTDIDTEIQTLDNE